MVQHKYLKMSNNFGYVCMDQSNGVQVQMCTGFDSQRQEVYKQLIDGQLAWMSKLILSELYVYDPDYPE